MDRYEILTKALNSRVPEVVPVPTALDHAPGLSERAGRPVFLKREDLTPIFWDDNYFSLLPGEKRTVNAKFERPTGDAPKPVLVLDGWNVAPTTLGSNH